MNVITSSLLMLCSTCLIVLFSISKLIYISHKKHLFDEPGDHRKIHSTKIPTLGGLAIVTGMLFTGLLVIPGNEIKHINYLLAATIALFAVGVTDDLVGIDPLKKMAAQILVACMATVFADMRLDSLYGIFGITTLPHWLSIGLSVFFILFLVNAVNLIDGIDGLAGSIGLLSSVIFAFLFYRLNSMGYFYLAIGMCGALSGFLFYNITPAKIFMGDTGSLFLGFILSIFSLKFMELSDTYVPSTGSMLTTNPVALIFALMIIPLFDTTRVFVTRLCNRRSPFIADRTHLHHELLNLGLTHLQSTGILISVNISCIFLVYFLKSTSPEITISITLGFALLWYGLLCYCKKEFIAVKSTFNNASPDFSPARVNVNFILKTRKTSSPKTKVSLLEDTSI